MSAQLTFVAEIGIRPRSPLFTGRKWLRSVYSVGRYRSAWGIHRANTDPHGGDTGLSVSIWINTGIATKREAIARAHAAIASATKGTP